LNSKDAFSYVGRGRLHYERGLYDKAIADCSDALRIDPKLAEAYYGRSLAYGQKGDKTRSEADLRRARELGYKP
jgi:tetratricopeptide (TPR) repeat protein